MRSRTASFLSLWLPVVGALALIYFLSSRTAHQLRYIAPDYVGHAAEYAILGLVLARALNGGFRPWPRPRTLGWTVLLCLVWAIGDEIHQAYVPTRVSSAADVAADLAGCALACGFLLGLWLIGRGSVGAVAAAREAVPGPANLVFLTRQDCHLCLEARQVLDRVLPDHHVDLEVLDVDSEQELAQRYGHEIPVLLLNGAKASKLRMDEGRLRRRLRPWRRVVS